MEMNPIGHVRNNAGRRRRNDWREVVSDIVIDPKYTEALEGLEEFSHIYVLFHLHEVNRPFKEKVHPTGNPEYPLVGAFATRTPNRPNPIGLTVCKLVSRNENVLTVKGLDAYDGSPVIDIKPYSPLEVGRVKVPRWVLKIEGSKWNSTS